MSSLPLSILLPTETETRTRCMLRLCLHFFTSTTSLCCIVTWFSSPSPSPYFSYCNILCKSSFSLTIYGAIPPPLSFSSYISVSTATTVSETVLSIWFPITSIISNHTFCTIWLPRFLTFAQEHSSCYLLIYT